MVPEGEREDRFRIAVSILIALVAVTGALISWKISRVNDRASSFDSDAIIESFLQPAQNPGIHNPNEPQEGIRT